ncbi:hypothetical protein GQ457_03G004720 [Hibiscus cannabinus]
MAGSYLVEDHDFNCMTDSSFVPPLVYAFMGSSRDIAIGLVAVGSLLLGSLLQDESDSSANPVYIHTHYQISFLGICYSNFLSHAAIVGFMAGAAITIALQQLKGPLGFKKFRKDTDIGKWQKKLFWVPAIAPLISVILSTVLMYATRADKSGVQIVKNIRKGINPPSAKEIFFSVEYVGKGFKIGVISGTISLTKAVAIGRTFAPMTDYQLDGNKEMVAIGTMNIVGPLTSCYVELSIATGSFSRPAVNFMSGCKTAVSNIVMALITPLFKYTPNAILASIIISAVVGQVDIDAVALIWKIDKFNFVACMGASPVSFSPPLRSAY